MKMIILPRQAPDKHRKNSKKSIVFLTGFQCNGKQVFQRKLYQGDDSKTLFVLFQPDGHTHWVIGRPERVWDCENRGFINSPKDSCPLSVRKNCPLLRLAVFLLRTKEKPIVCQDRLGTNIRKLNKNGPFSRTTTQPDQSECSSRWLENRGKEKKKAVLEVRKRRFCPTTFRISKTISLPRQARDKNHRENDSKKSTTVRLFIQCYACRPPSP
jgi:hypothetical protein